MNNTTTDGTTSRSMAITLAFVMVLSMVAVPLGAGTAVAQANNSTTDEVTNLSGYDIVWQGQEINVSNNSHPFSAGDSVQLRRDVTDGNDELIQLFAIDSNGTLSYDSGELQSGESYYFTTSNRNTQYPTVNGDLAPFEVLEHQLELDLESDTVRNGGDSSEAEIAVDTNRLDDGYVIEVDSDDLSPSEIESAVSGADVTVDSDDEVAEFTNFGEEFTIDFDGLETGDYAFDYVVPSTNASGTLDVNVLGAEQTNVEFSQGAYTGERGEIVEFEVAFDGSADGTYLTIGNETRSGYELNAQVDATSDAETATFKFNTYTAGDGTADALTTESDEVTIQSATETSIDGGDAMLEAATYEMTLKQNQNARTNSISLIDLRDSEFNGFTTSVAPAGSEFSDSDNITSNAVEGVPAVTDREEVASGDVVVYHADTAMLEGVFGDTDINEFDLVDLYNSDSVEFDVQVENEEPNRNRNFDAEETLGNAQDVFIDDDGLYFVIPIEDHAFTGGNSGDTFYSEAGDSYDVEFEITDERLRDESTDIRDEVDATFNGSDQFTHVERTFNVANQNTDNGTTTLTVDTSVAPSTEVTARAEARAESASAVFVQTDEYVVNQNGSFTHTIDTSGLEDGDSFRVVYDDATTQSSDTITLDLGSDEPVNPPENGTDDPVDNGTDDPVDNGSDPVDNGTDDGQDDGQDDEPVDNGTDDDQDDGQTDEPVDEDPEQSSTETDDSIPGFGAVVALIALIAAALVATRRGDSSE